MGTSYLKAFWEPLPRVDVHNDAIFTSSECDRLSRTTMVQQTSEYLKWYNNYIFKSHILASQHNTVTRTRPNTCSASLRVLTAPGHAAQTDTPHVKVGRPSRYASTSQRPSGGAASGSPAVPWRPRSVPAWGKEERKEKKRYWNSLYPSVLGHIFTSIWHE